ncbi:MAG: two-component regulator propeller domain-containing protein [Tenuifilaceae bacterium]
MKKPLFWVVFLQLLTILSYSQNNSCFLDPNKKITQYICKNWTMENGLPTNSLVHICQTKDGYLWISSYSGLTRFDGINFKVFNKKNTDIFESDGIRELAEDNNGTLWITTQNSGLLAFKDGEFKSIGKEQGIKHLYRALHIDKKNRIWAASPEKGWFYYENDEFHFISQESHANFEVRSIAESKDGSIWFGTLGQGLFQFVDGSFKTFKEKDGLPSDWIYSMYVDDNDNLWIGTGNGLSFFDGKIFKTIPLKNQNTITGIEKDKYGFLWLGTINGLYRIDPITLKYEFLSSENGLINDFINDILLDIEGNLWMTNYKGGLSELKGGKFTLYSESSGLPGKVVNAICEIDSNVFLVAFDNGFMSKISNGVSTNFGFKSLSGKRIRHILKDRNKNLWISTYSGLLKINSKNEETWYHEETGFPDTQIRLTFEDTKGNIWVGTRNNGLIKTCKDKPHIIFNTSNGLTSNLILSIDEDKNGNILVGTSEGIEGFNIIYEDKVQKTFGEKDGFFGDIVFNTFTDKNNYVWLATNNGLSCFYDGKFTNFTTKQGLAEDATLDILEDNYGYLWLPFSKGIMRIKKQELLDYIDNKITSVTCRVFDKHDGMKVSECNPTAQSLKARDGSLLFPTIDGIAQIDPSSIPFNNFIPPVIIEDLIVDNVKINKNNYIEFQPGKKRFTFNYTAINLFEPEKVEFKYMLEGFEDEWVDAGSNRTISYTNLTHGNYTFKVIACNNDGVWNNTGSSISFSIEPRFIETIWFYILIIISIVIIVWLSYRARIVQLRNRQKVLERIIEKRTKELVESNRLLEHQKNEILSQNIELNQHKEEIQTQTESLEEQKGELEKSNAMKDKLFSIIAHDLRNPLGNFSRILELIVNDPKRLNQEEKENILRNLFEISKSTYHLLENLLQWSLSQRELIDFNPVSFDFKQINDEIIQQVIPFAQNKKISIISEVNTPTMIYADKNMVRTILRNLLNNSIKFTQNGGEIIVFSKITGIFLEIGIKDNGVGISEERKKILFSPLEVKTTYGTNNEQGIGLGLMICKEFAEKNDGFIRYDSKEGEGSTFYFTLKIRM